MEKLARLAPLGAMAVAVGTFALYLVLVFVFRPVATGGMDRLGWQVLAIAMFVPVAVLAGAHVALARQLKAGPQPIL